MIICPLKFNNKNINADNITNNKEYKCEKENCAWFDKDTEECVVHNLGAIAEVMWNEYMQKVQTRNQAG